MNLREDVTAGEVKEIGKLLGVEGECSRRDIAEAIRLARSLTKRELFAAMAWHAFLSRVNKDDTVQMPEKAAGIAFLYADAFLEEAAKVKS